MSWSRRHTLLTGLAIIAITNTIALGGAYYNRSGEAESTLRLTQRELRPPYVWRGRNENSGLNLRLRWRVVSDEARYGDVYRYLGNYGGSPAWLDANKMASLGFGKDLPGRDGMQERLHYQRSLRREVLLVLELDGAAYREMLDRLAKAAKEVEVKNNRGEGKKDAAELVDWETRQSSRLFAVDAGLERSVLRGKYPDRARYAIVHGKVRPMWSNDGKGAAGVVETIDTDAVNVPLEMRDTFEGVAEENYGSRYDDGKHFEATLAFGQRLEPWLVSAEKK